MLHAVEDGTMVELCSECDEPATCFLTTQGGSGDKRTTYCYRHAASVGLVSPIPASVSTAGRIAECSANAALFLADVLNSRPEALRSPAACCIVVWDAARQRFGPSGERVLGCWQVAEGNRLALVIQALSEAGVIAASREVVTRVCRGMRQVGEIPIS